MCAFLSFHEGEAEPWRKAAIKQVRVLRCMFNSTQGFLPAEQERHRETHNLKDPLTDAEAVNYKMSEAIQDQKLWASCGRDW